MGVSVLKEDVQPFAELFQGATTLVYKAYQRSEDRVVLLKVLRPEFRFDFDLSRRFEEEAQLAARVRHPNVVEVYGYGQGDRGAFFIAEYVDGVDLAGIIRGGKVPYELAAYVIEETLRALEAAHNEGILHQDIKPSNILVSFEGEVKLTDFGMASQLCEQVLDEVRGTLAYMTPEQAQGEPVTPASDLFSLGATFFELLTGRPAFTGDTANDYFNSILQHDPTVVLDADPNLPDQLKRIARRLLAKRVSQRYAIASEVIADLRQFWALKGTFNGPAAMKCYLEDPVLYRLNARVFFIEPDSVRSRHVHTADMQPYRGSFRNRLSRSYAKDRVGWISVISIMAFVIVFLIGVGELGGLHNSSNRPEERIAMSGLHDGILSGETIETEFPETDIYARMLDAAEAASGRARRNNQAESVAPELLKPIDEAPVQRLPTLTETTLSTKRAGSLQIEVQPFAAVYVNGDSVGVTPLVRSLSPGYHKVTFKHKDFPETKRDIYIRPGEKTDLHVSLWSEVAQVNLSVSPWAHVYVDGQKRDTTPLGRPLILTPGEHILMLQHDLLGEWQTRINVVADSVYTLEYNLSELLKNKHN